MAKLSVRSNVAMKFAYHGEASSLTAGSLSFTRPASKRIPNRTTAPLTYIPKVKLCLSWLKCRLSHPEFTLAGSVRRRILR